MVDSELKKVLVIDLSGNLIGTLGEGTLISPTGLAYDPVNDWVYVAEHGGIGSGFKPKIKIWTFNTEGTLVRSVGSYGNGNGQFYRIQGLAVGKCGKLYATDPLLGTVSVFDKTDFIAKFGEYGKKPGQLNAPLDIVTDPGGQIWITSMNNSSVEVFKMNDSFPSSSISSSRTNICPGETTEIAVYFTGTAPWTFTYTKDEENPKVVSKVTDNPYILNVSDAGLYKIVTLSDAKYTATCNAGSVEININSLPLVNLGEDIHICEGEVFTLDAGAFTSYLWNDGSTNRMLQVNKSGNYSVMVRDSTGCENSAEVKVTTDSLPVSEFTYNDNYLEVSFINTSINADSYLWNFDDNEISREANPVHFFKTSGEYKVTLTASNGRCRESVFSKTIHVLGTIVENTGIENFAKVYPNPSNGLINIEVNKPVRIDLRIEITNISGQKVYSRAFKTQKEVNQINLTGYPKGFYTIKFISKDFIKTEKIIISK